MALDMSFRKLEKGVALSLEVPFTREEIREAVWRCNENKAPGPDTFNMYFFKKC